MTLEYNKLEKSLLLAIRQLKRDVAHLDENYLQLSISANGRLDGDIDITFTLSKGYGSDEVHARSGNLKAVVDEYIHQVSWQKRNKPLCLPNVDPIPDLDSELSTYSAAEDDTTW